MIQNIYIARVILDFAMLYVAIAFMIRYPTNILAFSYITFLCAIFIEVKIWLAPIMDINLIQSKWFQVLFECSWTSNFAIFLTTIFFFFNPEMIKDMNFASTTAFIEMLLMHYTPVIIHIIHIYEYPRFYKDTNFLFTLIFPIIYYGWKNNISYFQQNELTFQTLVKQNAIIVMGGTMQYLAQVIGVWFHNTFHYSRESRPKAE